MSTYLCTGQDDLSGDEDEEDDFRLHHSIYETGEKLKADTCEYPTRDIQLNAKTDIPLARNSRNDRD